MFLSDQISGQVTIPLVSVFLGQNTLLKVTNLFMPLLHVFGTLYQLIFVRVSQLIPSKKDSRLTYFHNVSLNFGPTS